jgi:hypothetical protein
MTTPPNDTDALRDVLAELAGGEAGDDPTPEELVDYLAGRLPPDEEERLQRRLVASPAAARMLVDLQELAEAEPTAGGGAPADLPVRAGWRDLRRRLAGAAPPFRRLNRALAAAAAALALVAAGLGGWAWTLQQELRLASQQAALQQPVANLVSLELDASRRSAVEPEVPLEPGAPLELVIAVPAGADDCAPFRAEVAKPSGGEWEIDGLVPSDLGPLTLLLPPTEPGRDTVRLSGCEPRRRFPEDGFRVVAGTGGTGR